MWYIRGTVEGGIFSGVGIGCGWGDGNVSTSVGAIGVLLSFLQLSLELDEFGI